MSLINSIIGLVLIVASIFAIIKIYNSSETTGVKILWIVLILILPLLGLIVWYLSGPGDKSLTL